MAPIRHAESRHRPQCVAREALDIHSGNRLAPGIYRVQGVRLPNTGPSGFPRSRFSML
jgi:hypothetical protein